MKTPIILASNDWHIKPDNTSVIIDLVYQLIATAKKMKVGLVVVLGDIFQSRQAQPLVTLKCFETILDMFHETDLKLIVFPGNHDKTNYESEDSFLDSFAWHPSLTLVNNHFFLKESGAIVRMIPFFSEEKWLSVYSDNIERQPIKGTDILLSHIAVTGSVNNDGSKVDSIINPSLFREHTAVFLGHYHNTQRIGKNIVHLPSIQQNNFGEDNNKGFTIIYDDGSFEIIKSKFKEYRTVEIDLEVDSIKTVNEDIKKLDIEENFYRLKIKGNEDKIKSIKLDELKSMGFKVQTEQKEVSVSIEEVENGEIINFTESAILEEFDLFCEKENYEDVTKGLTYLNKKLNEGKGL